MPSQKGESMSNNFQGSGVVQGERFHDECILALELAGFEVVETKVRLRDVGIELDAITNNKHGIAMAWEFKGSLQGSRPGLIRTDTTKKAIANALLLSRSEYGEMMPPLLIMTSHIPTKDDSRTMLQAVLGREILTVVDSRDGKSLQNLCNATSSDIHDMLR